MSIKTNTLRKNCTNWSDIHYETFINWVRFKLVMLPESEFDFTDGISILNLVEQLSHPYQIMNHIAKPNTFEDKLYNMNLVMDFLAAYEKLDMSHVDTLRLLSGDRNHFCAVIWNLIKHYQIVHSYKSMLLWVKSLIAPFTINSFGTEWTNGKLLTAIITSLKTGLAKTGINTSGFSKERCKIAMYMALTDIGVPKLFSPSDLATGVVDDICLMTYISIFIEPFMFHLLKWVRTILPNKRVSNFSLDWRNGLLLSSLIEEIFPGLCPELTTRRIAFGCASYIQSLFDRLEGITGVKPVMSANDFTSTNVNELLVAVYIQSLRRYSLMHPQLSAHRIRSSNGGDVSDSSDSGLFFQGAEMLLDVPYNELIHYEPMPNNFQRQSKQRTVIRSSHRRALSDATICSYDPPPEVPETSLTLAEIKSAIGIIQAYPTIRNSGRSHKSNNSMQLNRRHSEPKQLSTSVLDDSSNSECSENFDPSRDIDLVGHKYSSFKKSLAAASILRAEPNNFPHVCSQNKEITPASITKKTRSRSRTVFYNGKKFKKIANISSSIASISLTFITAGGAMF